MQEHDDPALQMDIEIKIPTLTEGKMTCVSLSQPPQMSCIVAIGIILGDWHDTGAGTSEKVAADNIVL